MVICERDKLCTLLLRLGGKHIHSQTNFVMIFPQERYEPLSTAFIQSGIAVRRLSLRGERVMRISVGLPQENRQVERVLSDIFG